MSRPSMEQEERSSPWQKPKAPTKMEIPGLMRRETMLTILLTLPV